MLSSYGCLLSGNGKRFGIKDAVRGAAMKVARFDKTKEGCLLVASLAMCEYAYSWLGASGPFVPGDATLVADYYKILPGGTFEANYEDESTPVNTASVAMGKVAQLMRLRAMGMGLLSVYDPELTLGLKPESGYANWRGALCCEVYCADGSLFALIFVSVSGASQDEDLACAAAAIDVIRNFFPEDFEVKAPDIENNA